jgi:clan AA aspartic protease
MGHLHQRVKLTGERSVTLDMLVDTGATYSIVSEELAQKIGVTRYPRPVTMTLADGRRKELETGVATFTVAGREAPAMILIGKVAEPILGVETLEVLGLAVDPRRQRVIPTRGYAVRG